MRKRATELTFRTLGVVAWLAAAATAAYFGFYDSTATGTQREPVARLLKASGDVEAHSPNLLGWTPVAAGHEFAELDHLATAANGRATLILPSGHRLELGGDAHVDYSQIPGLDSTGHAVVPSLDGGVITTGTVAAARLPVATTTTGGPTTWRV